MVGSGAGAWLTAMVPKAELVNRCWVTGRDAELLTEYFWLQWLSMSLPRNVIEASLAACYRLCCWQLEVKKKCPQAGLNLTVAAGMWVRERKCILDLGPAEATQGVSCDSQMTSEMTLELGVSRQTGKQKLEKTVWVIPASSLSLVLIFPVYLFRGGISGSFSFVHMAGVINTCGRFLSLLAGFYVAFRGRDLHSALGPLQHLASCWPGFETLCPLVT